MSAPAAVPASFECVEIYIPKKLEHLSELYNFLRQKLTQRAASTTPAVPIEGFSMYEVDGAFRGAEIYQERTIVIRILFSRGADDDDAAIRQRIMALGSEVAAKVALEEEELWICHYPQGVVIVRPTGGTKCSSGG